MIELNKNIIIVEKERKIHSKATEEYIHVNFTYDTEKWDGWVPVEYRRTGVSIESEEQLTDYLNKVYEQMQPSNFSTWLNEQNAFWNSEKKKAGKTKAFFDCLIKGGWQCIGCTLPENPNWARRAQNLKEYGYTIATYTKRYCPKCKAKKTHLLLLPLPRKGDGNGYETWSPTLRKRIIKVLGAVDAYENKVNRNCLPDHKFSEIRWDSNTKEENKDDMTDEQIRQKFQLLTNQRNEQKREICRNCFQTGKRGTIYGIPFYYAGGSEWDKSIPQKGKAAENGCIGCPWYDIERWRKELIKQLKK